MVFESIIGQERPIRFLSQVLEKKRIPNAFLFTGIDGIGKQKTARAFGMALNCKAPTRFRAGLPGKGVSHLCQAPLGPARPGEACGEQAGPGPVGVSACGTCPSCRKVVSGLHPDIMNVDPDGAFIKIDQVRDLARQLRFTPLEGKWRTVIINDAHCMNVEASNAILKMLEEPPTRTVIILTAGQTTDLLPTIVSRCQQITFRPIPYEKVAEALVREKALDKETALTLALCTKGSLGKALSVEAQKWSEWRTRLLEQMASLSPESIQPVLAFANALSRDKARLGDGLDMIMTWFRDVLMCQIAPEKIINQDFMKDIEKSSQGRPVNEILKKVEAVHRTQALISQNVNARLALEVMMIRLSTHDAQVESA